MPVDEELVTALKRAKSATAKTPHNFVFVMKGGTDGGLLVSHQKVTPGDIAKVKKSTGGSAVLKGHCFGEEGKLIFEMAKVPAATMAPALKKVIKRDTEFSYNVECRMGTNPLLAEDAQDTAHPVTLKTPVKPAESAADEWKRRLAAMTPRMTQALRTGDKKTFDEIKNQFALAKSSADAKDFGPALSRLRSLEGLVTEVLQEAVDSERNEQGVHNLFIELSGKIKSALSDPKGPQIDQQLKDSISSLLNDAKTDLTDKKAAAARLKLDELKNLLPKISAPADSSHSDGKSLIKKMNDLAEPIKELLKGPRKGRVLELVSDFKGALDKNEFDKAGGVLEELGTYLKQPPGGGKTTQEWKKRFALKNQGGDIHLKNYKVGKLIGSGGNGDVRRLENPGSPPLVGKFLNAAAAAFDPDLLTKEAKVYERLGDHPNIPKCLGVVKVGDEDALVLEAVEGDTWKKNLAKLKDRYDSSKGGNLSHEEYWGAVQYTTAKTLQTLAFIEDRGMVHTDIKPENLMIDKDGELKVIDLGGAVNKNEKIPESTPKYSPPQTEFDKAAGAFDVFETGKVASEFAQGKPGFASEYARLCELLTAKNPGDRPSARKALQHPFFAQALLDEETARQILSGDIAVTPGFDQMAFDKTMASAIKLKKIDAKNYGDAIATTSSLLRTLAEPHAQLEALSGGLKLEAMKRASKLLDDLVAALKKLSTVATGALANYLAGMMQEASKRKKDIEDLQKPGPRGPVGRQQVRGRGHPVPPKT